MKAYVRDLTDAQFDAECTKRGFTSRGGFLGYYTLPGTPTMVSTLNAGPTRRNQLVYLIREHRRLTKEVK
jgi:hypothetical protein